ncbi:hypothetical protein M1M40_gp59 [Halorubrum tailed virus 29]|uniref:Uncharacterized protein n=1 Tax=Halorubrum tailed virus 29 TaxID=2878010 RepID=A0AAE8XZR1_9CAUD|nr:hypothetical protein M1M40_gp59 [Halorubrum tailed virus 29]UBF23337.1 hypothetical protein HRTV-29_gp59 [Halorubrum tailed virus 29]
MTWDDSKKTFQTRPDVPADEKLTSGEWNNHVTDQQNRGYNDLSTVTADYTAGAQEIVLVDASGGPVTVTLPAPESAASVVVKKIDASGNAVTIATPGGETIDGDSERTLTATTQPSREIMSDGTNYFII